MSRVFTGPIRKRTEAAGPGGIGALRRWPGGLNPTVLVADTETMTVPVIEHLGQLRSRHHGAVLNRTSSSEFFGSDHPWMVFEVRDLGLAVQPDPRRFAQFRRWTNIVLGVLRPLNFLLSLGDTAPVRDVWTMTWDHIAQISTPKRKTLVVETNHGSHMRFRFGSSGGLRDTIAKLGALGVACQQG